MVRRRHHGNASGNRLSDRERKNKRNLWLYIGVGVLILLLLVWMTIASFWEDTDVAAFIAPLGF